MRNLRAIRLIDRSTLVVRRAFHTTTRFGSSLSGGESPDRDEFFLSESVELTDLTRPKAMPLDADLARAALPIATLLWIHKIARRRPALRPVARDRPGDVHGPRRHELHSAVRSGPPARGCARSAPRLPRSASAPMKRHLTTCRAFRRPVRPRCQTPSPVSARHT